MLRDKTTSPDHYRSTCNKLTTILALEATRSIRTRVQSISTPLTDTDCDILDQDLAVVPILRAGLGMLHAFVELFPNVAVGYVGLERDEESAIARSYYCKVPSLEGKFALCIDPMLATGGSAAQAVSLMKSHGATSITMVSIIAALEGVEAFQAAHPDVPIFCAALDSHLNEKKYIVPGLGDFGDRLYGTG